ncbi:hypothetical protein MUK42_25481 [Musa troglodytarum]|uniref:Uncharacterized protein n=1 Tax=Musa troglodytarum TaxID=320322 RepID=A0A9E7I417_9LILI|nr:hypothetical protein MUK42_25481 [Musa troglodytarum]
MGRRGRGAAGVPTGDAHRQADPPDRPIWAGGGDRMGCEDRRFTHPAAAVAVARHVPSCRLEDYCRVR